MGIDILKAAVAAGVGAVDEYLERDDVSNNRNVNDEGNAEHWRTWTAMGRVGMTVVGYGGQFAPWHLCLP